MPSSSGAAGEPEVQPVGQTRTPGKPVQADSAPLWKRLAWLLAIWAASITVLGTVAYGIRLWLKA